MNFHDLEKKPLGHLEQRILDLYKLDGKGNIISPLGNIIHGAKRSDKYLNVSLMIDGRQKSFLKHRIVFLLKHRWLPRKIDHIDCDPMNNAPDNLRPANDVQNAAYARKRRGTSSRFKGVAYVPDKKKFLVRCGPEYIGYYDNELVAANAYDRAAIRRWGPYALTNLELALRGMIT